MLYSCTGFWKDERAPAAHWARIEGAIISDGAWDGIEGAEDERVFFYTEGAPVIGDHGEFIIIEAEAV